jgi:hypothetical protein
VIVAQGNLWTWDDEPVAARAVRTEGHRVIDDHPFGSVIEGAICGRNVLYGSGVHAFEPQPDKGRSYWLLTWPMELEPKRAAYELLCFVLTMLPDEGKILLPDLDDSEIGPVLDQPIMFSTQLQANGLTVADTVESVGNRFVVLEHDDSPSELG